MVWGISVCLTYDTGLVLMTSSTSEMHQSSSFLALWNWRLIEKAVERLRTWNQKSGKAVSLNRVPGKRTLPRKRPWCWSWGFFANSFLFCPALVFPPKIIWQNWNSDRSGYFETRKARSKANLVRATWRCKVRTICRLMETEKKGAGSRVYLKATVERVRKYTLSRSSAPWESTCEKDVESTGERIYWQPFILWKNLPFFSKKSSSEFFFEKVQQQQKTLVLPNPLKTKRDFPEPSSVKVE